MDQDVEWGYAFDVHLNAFFPTMAILHGFQLIFLGNNNDSSFRPECLEMIFSFLTLLQFSSAKSGSLLCSSETLSGSLHSDITST